MNIPGAVRAGKATLLGPAGGAGKVSLLTWLVLVGCSVTIPGLGRAGNKVLLLGPDFADKVNLPGARGLLG